MVLCHCNLMDCALQVEPFTSILFGYLIDVYFLSFYDHFASVCFPSKFKVVSLDNV